MASFKYNLAAVALGMASVSAVLTPGVASAATPAVQVQLCTTSSRPAVAWIIGLNQHGTSTTSKWVALDGKDCTTVSNYWWRAGQTVAIKYRLGSPVAPIQQWNCSIQSNVQDGSTRRCTFG